MTEVPGEDLSRHGADVQCHHINVVGSLIPKAETLM